MNGTGPNDHYHAAPYDGGGWVVWFGMEFVTYRLREEDACAEVKRLNDELQVFDAG